jgi:hypothetical protein
MSRHLWVAILTSALVAGALPAAAQNGYSFIDAEKSVVRYSLATVMARKACRDLAGLSQGELTVTAAEPIAASDGAPAFCRVVAVIQPAVQIEVALPTPWNRRLWMRGNGGFAGEALDAPVRVAQRNEALKRGFVAAQTNTGHDAAGEPLGSFAPNNLQKVIDYSFRAVHVTAEAAKRLAAAYYDRQVSYAYFDGCSTGGRQGLMSAQRYPADFDGILVGAPVLNFTDTMVWNVWNARALAETPIPIEKMSLVADRVYRKCDAKDGAADGLINDPRRCDFDPAADLPRCAAGQDAADCVTDGQIAALTAIYGGVKSGGKPYFWGQPVGAEATGIPFTGAGAPVSGWDEWLISKTKSRQLIYAESFLRNLAFLPQSDASYDWKSFDLAKDVPRMAPIARLLDATNPDLSEFQSRGGRILMYFGWADTALNPLMGIDYYEKVTATLGPSTRDFYRLFMVPGMFHCRGGVGADRFDGLTPLIDWVESGKAPERLLAEQRDPASGRTIRSRPLCPHPQEGRYSGNGSLDDAASFACQAPQ